MKKICYSCGSKVIILYDGICEKCLKEQVPPIQEIKPINLKICNSCKKIHYNNQLLLLEEVKEMLPSIVEKRLVLAKEYKLEKLKINNFETSGNKIIFDVDVKCSIK